MNDYMTEGNGLVSRTTLVASLLVGALGIALLWAGGVDFPIAVPPGIVILVVGAVVVATVRARWAAALGCFLGVFVLVGFLVSGQGFDNLAGDEGALPAIGQAVEVLGVLVAAVTGALLVKRRA
jgi:hypothetical protein